MDSQSVKEFKAVRAVIAREGKILLIRESAKYDGGAQHGRYDFPGGKIRESEGETERQALCREALEEVGLSITPIAPFFTAEWTPVVKGEQLRIVGCFYFCICHEDAGEVVLSKDHDHYVWEDPHAAEALPLIKEVRDAIVEFQRLSLSELS